MKTSNYINTPLEAAGIALKSVPRSSASPADGTPEPLTVRAGGGAPKDNTYTLLGEIRTSILATIILAIVVSGIYPVIVYGLGKLFPYQANGSLIVAADGKTILGSELLGQNFGGKQYFNPRPSAAGAAGYDPTATGGTNLGPTSDKLVNGQHKKDAAGKPVADPNNYDGIKDLVPAYRAANNLKDTDAVPADAVTRSGSGMDPHISLANAELQLPRVAAERKMDVATLRAIVAKHTHGRDWGLFGEPTVNTLTLNLDLDGKLPK
jgi:K+-transporting ATPase ATPase C chain